jgi:thioredoxin 1
MKNRNIFTIPMLLWFIFTSCQAQPTDTKKEATKSSQSEVIHLTNTTFKQKVFDYEKSKEWKFAGDKPCIIDFYADWCGPCRMLSPTIEQIAKDYQGKIYVYKVNVDEQKELASAFGISSIPAILFCPKTQQPQMSTGYISKADFVKAIKEVLNVQ